MISIARLISELGASDESTVGKLIGWRDSAIAFIETQTNRYFRAIASTTETIQGSGTRSLWLQDIPQVGGAYTTTVLEYSYPGAVGEVVTIGASDGFILRIQGREARLLRAGSGGVWTADYDYAVTYSRGYADDLGPKDVETLVIELLKIRIANEGREGINSETIGGYSYSKPATYAFEDGDLKQIPGAYQTIQSWRRLVFA